MTEMRMRDALGRPSGRRCSATTGYSSWARISARTAAPMPLRRAC